MALLAFSFYEDPLFRIVIDHVSDRPDLIDQLFNSGEKRLARLHQQQGRGEVRAVVDRPGRLAVEYDPTGGAGREADGPPRRDRRAPGRVP